MTDYEWLTEMGLCHRCRKRTVVSGKKFCIECLEKIREENHARYDSEYAKNYQKRRRKIYAEKKEKGICVRCKKDATHGMYCYEHYIKERRRRIKRAETEKRKRHERGLIPEERKANGLCIWCGKKAITGKNICEEHMKIFSKAGRKASGSDKEVDRIWKMKKLKNSGRI